jgi:hypothetical protein
MDFVLMEMDMGILAHVKKLHESHMGFIYEKLK